jgi:hypothetical protein
VPHQRQVIRAAVAAALVGQTAAGARVEPTRMVPWRPAELPGIGIYTLRERVEPESRDTAPRELERRFELAIEGCVRADAGVDDALDALALEIERVLHADATFGGTASDSLLAQTEIDVLENGDQPIGVIRLVYEVWYFTGAPEAADVTLDDLKTVDIHHDLEGQQETDDQAHDVVDDLDQ